MSKQESDVQTEHAANFRSRTIAHKVSGKTHLCKLTIFQLERKVIINLLHEHKENRKERLEGVETHTGTFPETWSWWVCCQAFLLLTVQRKKTLCFLSENNHTFFYTAVKCQNVSGWDLKCSSMERSSFFF